MAWGVGRLPPGGGSPLLAPLARMLIVPGPILTHLTMLPQVLRLGAWLRAPTQEFEVGTVQSRPRGCSFCHLFINLFLVSRIGRIVAK